MLIWILAILLVLLTAFSYLFFDDNAASPSFLFCLGFSVSAIVAAFYAGNWSFSLGFETFCIVLMGCVTFVAAAAGARLLVKHKSLEKRGKIADKPRHLKTAGNVFPSWRRFTVLAVVQLFVFVVTLSYIQNMSPDLSISEAISRYNSLSTFTTEDVSFPFPFRQFRGFIVSGTYVVSFLAGQQLARRLSPQIIPCLICIVFSFALTLELGYRTDCLVLAICIFTAFCIERERLGNSGLLSDRRIVIALLVMILVGIFSFRFLAFGRDLDSYNTLDYLAEYLGAQIPNLDTFVSTNAFPVNQSIPGYMTFINDYGYLAEKLGISEWSYVLDLPFLDRNGYDMGNVYTTFYAYLYDFGYLGVVLLTAIEAFVSQLIFEAALRCKYSDYFGILYGYVAATLALSFFSNKFFESIFIGSIVAFTLMGIFYFLFVRVTKEHLSYWLDCLKEKLIGKEI